MSDLAEQMERMGKELLALMAKVNANSKAMMDALVKTKPRQSERTESLLDRLMSPLPKE